MGIEVWSEGERGGGWVMMDFVEATEFLLQLLHSNLADRLPEETLVSIWFMVNYGTLETSILTYQVIE